MTEAAAERTISDEAENDAEIEDIWTVPDELELADDDLRTTKSVQIVYPSNHLSPIQDPNSPRQEKVNPDEKRGKNWRPNLIEDDNAPIRVTRSTRSQKLLSAVNISGSCPTARNAAS